MPRIMAKCPPRIYERLAYRHNYISAARELRNQPLKLPAKTPSHCPPYQQQGGSPTAYLKAFGRDENLG